MQSHQSSKPDEAQGNKADVYKPNINGKAFPRPSNVSGSVCCCSQFCVSTYFVSLSSVHLVLCNSRYFIVVQFGGGRVSYPGEALEVKAAKDASTRELIVAYESLIFGMNFYSKLKF